MKPFLEAIDERVLVCDGAMGTMLYTKGVFINRCFDALNLTDPARVAEVHQEYVRAGADVLETNTFGANRVKLRGFGLADRLREINIEGARLARSAAIRSICGLPIVAQMTIEEDGSSLDGAPPEQFAPALALADVLGVNCSIGPAPMLETIERMASVTRTRLSAQPNAGRPRDIEGRNIYLSSPEYMASYARRSSTSIPSA